MKTTRNDAGHYTIKTDGHRFTAETLERLTEGAETTGGWRLLIETPIEGHDDLFDVEWCNDFATLWECKEAAQLTADDKNLEGGVR